MIISGENATWNESNIHSYVINESRWNLNEYFKCWWENIEVRIELNWNYVGVKFRDFITNCKWTWFFFRNDRNIFFRKKGFTLKNNEDE